jgi:hypothetical protein
MGHHVLIKVPHLRQPANRCVTPKRFFPSCAPKLTQRMGVGCQVSSTNERTGHQNLVCSEKPRERGFRVFWDKARGTSCDFSRSHIEDLSNASRKGQLQQALLTYTRPHVLVIDEVGYLTYGQDAANVLFHVVNHRHLKKRPMIFTTNKPPSEWGKVLHDEDLAAATLDRVLERGRFVHLDGPSGRTRHLQLEEALPAPPERARISGTHTFQSRKAVCNGLLQMKPNSDYAAYPNPSLNDGGDHIGSLLILVTSHSVDLSPANEKTSGFRITDCHLDNSPSRFVGDSSGKYLCCELD